MRSDRLRRVLKARKKILEYSVKKSSIRKHWVTEGFTLMSMMKGQGHSPHEASSRQHVTRSVHHQERKPPRPQRAGSHRTLLSEWIGSLGKLLDPHTLFLAAKEGCQDRGSSASENQVNRLWRGSWKRNHSENSQMASSDCAVLAPSIFVLLLCICWFQPQ